MKLAIALTVGSSPLGADNEFGPLRSVANINHTDRNVARTKQSKSISMPFNFTVLTQGNHKDASVEVGAHLGNEWNRALHRESQSRPTTSQGSQQFALAHSRDNSGMTVATIRPNRSNSLSVRSISPAISCPDLSAAAAAASFASPACPSSPVDVVDEDEEEEVYHARAVTPPQRTSSMMFRKIDEHPEEEAAAAQQLNCDMLEDLVLGAVPEEEETQPNTGMPSIRTSQSTPFLSQKAEEHGYKHQMFLSVRSRPLSQLSQLSDTLNGNFIVPQSPNGRRTSMRARRVSHRMSAHMKLHGLAADPIAAIDSWEEDIDWCYENEVEADCDYDWDKDSSYEESTCDDQLQQTAVPAESNTALGDIPEEVSTPKVEKRITGMFEDRLLLPPSPRFPPSSFGGLSRPRDSGFESVHNTADEQSLVMRAGNTALRHRSVSSSPSLPELAGGGSYREELSRVARQLDEHIAALNKEIVLPQVPKRRPSIADNIRAFMGTRQRADSQATCVTLCSDTDASEAATPASSAHNSFNFAKQQRGGYDSRGEKGLSFPAAAIPGVIELGPDSLDVLYRTDEAEDVHYI